MIKSLLPAGIALIDLVSSCNHEPVPAPQSDVPTKANELAGQKITSGDQNVQTYSYSDQGLLSSFQSHWTYGDSASTVYGEQGYPTRKIQQLTTTKPLPARVLDYHYQ